MKKKRNMHAKGRNLTFLPLWTFCLILLCPACDDDKESGLTDYNPGLPVQVTDVSPSSGGIALPVVISGNNFGTDKKKVQLYFDNKEAVIITAQNEHLYAVVPKLKGGEHQVRVVVDGKNEGILEGKKFDYKVASSVTTVAGLGGTKGEEVDGPALEAKFYYPYSLDIDDKGNIIVCDWGWYIRLLSLESNAVTTLFTATSRQFYGGTFTPDYSTYYIALRSSSQTRLAYSFFRNGNWSEGLVINTDRKFDDQVVGITYDDQNYLFIIGYNGTIGKVNTSNGHIDVLGNIPDDFHAAEFSLAFNPADKYIYISSHWDDAILRFDSRKEKLEEQDVELYAGTPGGSSGGLFNGYRLDATFLSPRGIACDTEGNLYIADSDNHAIRMIDPEGNVTTYAGGNGPGSKDGVVENSSFQKPYDVAVSPEGFVYVADCYNFKIRCIAVQ